MGLLFTTQSRMVRTAATALLLAAIFCGKFAFANSPDINSLQSGVTVYLPFEELAVGRVAKRAAKYFDQNNVVEIEKHTAWIVRADLRELVLKLKSQNDNIVFYSELPQSYLLELASKILVRKAANGQAIRLNDLAAFVGGMSFNHELSFGDLHLARPAKYLIVTDGGIVFRQEYRVFSLGPYYTPYTEFKAAQRSKKYRSDEPEIYPADKASWETEKYNLGRLYLFLTEADMASPAKLVATVERFQSEDALNDSIVGHQMLIGHFDRYSYSFTTKPGTQVVQGCEVTDNRFVHDRLLDRSKHPVTMQIGLAACLKNVKLIPHWKADNKTKRATGCSEWTPDNRFEIKSDLTVDRCAADDTRLQHLRYANENFACYLFTPELYAVRNADDSSCDHKHNVIFISKVKSFTTFASFPGMKGYSLRDLEKAISKTPDDRHPLQMYQWWTDSKDRHPISLSGCLNNYNNTNMTDANGQVDPDCVTDTIYSWGTKEKLDYLKSMIGNEKIWSPIQTIYAARSPISTFGYGPILIRIKLKKGTRFVASPYGLRCDNSQENKVYVRLDTYADWVLCGVDEIHSWSYATPQLYDEVIREYKKYLNLVHAGHLIPSLFAFYSAGNQTGGIFGNDIDGHDFSKNTFMSNLKTMRDMIAQHQGHIYYNPDLPDSEKTPEKHYETQYPLN